MVKWNGLSLQTNYKIVRAMYSLWSHGYYQLRLADISYFVSHFEYNDKILATQKKFPAFNGYSLVYANAQLILSGIPNKNTRGHAFSIYT